MSLFHKFIISVTLTQEKKTLKEMYLNFPKMPLIFLIHEDSFIIHRHTESSVKYVSDMKYALIS